VRNLPGCPTNHQAKEWLREQVRAIDQLHPLVTVLEFAPQGS
jgi:hypothetical protein